MKKLIISSIVALLSLSCSLSAPNNSTQEGRMQYTPTGQPSLVRDTSSPSPQTPLLGGAGVGSLHPSLVKENFSDLEKEYKSFSTKALSDAYVSRMFNKFLTTTPNPTQVIRQLEFARYLQNVKSDSSYFNSLKTFIGSDIAKFNLINNTNEVSQKKSAESATFGAFVDSLNPNPFSLLLDTYPTASVAYSLRKLRSAYIGSAIRVRRSSDNSEQDFGFVNNILDTASILTFVGSGDGFVTKWYDQSGNARNLTQTTAASQPGIVNAGVIYSQNSKPMVKFDGTNDSLSLVSSLPLVNQSFFASVYLPYTISSVPQGGRPGGEALWSGGNSNDFFCLSNFTGALPSEILSWLKNSGGYIIGYHNSSTNIPVGNYIFNAIYNNTTNTTKIFQNNTVTATSVLSGGFGNSSYPVGFQYLGSTVDSTFSGFYEFVVYPSDQSTDRTAIESNINSYWSIY